MAHGKPLAEYQANSEHPANVTYQSNYSDNVRGAQITERHVEVDIPCHCLLHIPFLWK